MHLLQSKLIPLMQFVANILKKIGWRTLWEILDSSLSLIYKYKVINTESCSLKDRRVIKDTRTDKFTHSYSLILIILLMLDWKLFNG